MRDQVVQVTQAQGNSQIRALFNCDTDAPLERVVYSTTRTSLPRRSLRQGACTLWMSSEVSGQQSPSNYKITSVLKLFTLLRCLKITCTPEGFGERVLISITLWGFSDDYGVSVRFSITLCDTGVRFSNTLWGFWEFLGVATVFWRLSVRFSITLLETVSGFRTRFWNECAIFYQLAPCEARLCDTVFDIRSPQGEIVFEIRAQGMFLPAHFGSRATISQDVIENRTVK